MIVEPTALAFVRPGEASADLAPIAILARQKDAGAMLLARFPIDLPEGTTVIEAHVLLDRASSIDADPISPSAAPTLRAVRIGGAWDARSISWARVPRWDEADAPRTPLGDATRVARIDVRALVERWRAAPATTTASRSSPTSHRAPEWRLQFFLMRPGSDRVRMSRVLRGSSSTSSRDFCGIRDRE